MRYYEYDTTTGEIHRFYSFPKSHGVPIPRAGYEIIEVSAFDDNHYIDINQNPPLIKNKQDMLAIWSKMQIIANGLDTAVLTPLPIPCQIFIDGVEYTVNDGTLTFTASSPGYYIVKAKAVPYKAETWVIEVLP